MKKTLAPVTTALRFLKLTEPVLLQDCMYLHELGEEAASFTKEEMQQG